MCHLVQRLCFKQGLRLIPLCWEHEQPLSSAGHQLLQCQQLPQHAKMYGELHAPGSIFCSFIIQGLSCHSSDALCTLGQPKCTRPLCSSVIVLPARMASPFALPPMAFSPHSQPYAQPNRCPNELDAGNLAVKIVVLSCTEQPSSKQPPASGSQLGSEQGTAVTALGFVRWGCKDRDGQGCGQHPSSSGRHRQAPHPPALCSTDSGSPGKGEKRALFWGQD